MFEDMNGMETVRKMSIAELEPHGLPERVSNILQANGCIHVEDIIDMSGDDLLRKLPNFGNESLSQVREAIHNAAHGIISVVRGNNQYGPTPEEIQERCNEIQKKWKKADRQNRSGGKPNHWVPQEIATPPGFRPIE